MISAPGSQPAAATMRAASPPAKAAVRSFLIAAFILRRGSARGRSPLALGRGWGGRGGRTNGCTLAAYTLQARPRIISPSLAKALVSVVRGAYAAQGFVAGGRGGLAGTAAVVPHSTLPVAVEDRLHERRLVVVQQGAAERATHRATLFAALVRLRLLPHVLDGVLLDGLAQPARLGGAELDIAELVHVQIAGAGLALPGGGLALQQLPVVLVVQVGERLPVPVEVVVQVKVGLAADADAPAPVVEDVERHSQPQGVDLVHELLEVTARALAQHRRHVDVKPGQAHQPLQPRAQRTKRFLYIN